MGDGYWRYGDGRQPALPPLSGKRPRSDYDIPGGHEMPGYYPRESRDDERGGHRVIRDTESIGASYDRYLRNGQVSSFSGGESARSFSGGLLGHPVDDPRMVAMGSMDLGLAGKSRSMGFEGGKQEIPLPPDASNTLFVEGLPANCTRREVSHIFRPFVGFREVRLVSKESRHPGGEPLVLCFVDFGTPAQAATALDALKGGEKSGVISCYDLISPSATFGVSTMTGTQSLDRLLGTIIAVTKKGINDTGYKFDEHDRDSAIIRLQFARYPGPRSGGGSRGRR